MRDMTRVSVVNLIKQPTSTCLRSFAFKARIFISLTMTLPLSPFAVVCLGLCHIACRRERVQLPFFSSPSCTARSNAASVYVLKARRHHSLPCVQPANTWAALMSLLFIYLRRLERKRGSPSGSLIQIAGSVGKPDAAL